MSIKHILRRPFCLLPHPLQRLLLLPFKAKAQWGWRSRRIRSKMTGAGYVQDKGLYWVRPADVHWWTEKAFDVNECRGRVIGGDWDRLEQRFEDYDFYQAAVQRFKHGRGWEHTRFWYRAMAENTYGSIEEARRRCIGWDMTYESMKTEGYRPEKCSEQIAVNIGRNGNLMFNDGGHRLSIAKVLEVERVPVEVTVRHSEWEQFKEEVRLYAKANGGKAYAPLCHIDLGDVPYLHGHERFEIIKGSMGEGMRTLLDVGAHWGYFCHRFEELGMECMALEVDGEALYYLNRLKGGRRFIVMPTSFLELGMTVKHDVVLALSVFHHFVKRGRVEELRKVLERLECREMYLEPHGEGEHQMEKVEMSSEEMVRWVLENSCLEKKELIGWPEGRPLYKLRA